MRGREGEVGERGREKLRGEGLLEDEEDEELEIELEDNEALEIEVGTVVDCKLSEAGLEEWDEKGRCEDPRDGKVDCEEWMWSEPESLRRGEEIGP